MLSEPQRAFLLAHRVARLATADGHGQPHLVPVCFALEDGTAYIAVDDKPKRSPARALKRLRNIAENPAVALTVDRWDEDWSRLAWVMVRGRAEILEAGAEHDRAHALLRARYRQYRDMTLGAVIAIRIIRVTEWHAGEPAEDPVR